MIETQDLSKCYKTYSCPMDRLKQFCVGENKQYYQECWALKKLSVDIDRGEIVGIVGANGSGKSTLLQIIAGILRPTTGTVKVTGNVAALLELGAGFNPNFTGHENLQLNASLLGLSNEELEIKYEQIVQFADIGDFLRVPVRSYSSGMVVRLAFAIAAHVDADVLVIDEALSVGDVAFQSKCLSRMDELINKGCTVLLASHDQQMIKRYCTRALYLDQGNLLFDGSTEQALEHYLRDVFESQRNQLGKVIQKPNNIHRAKIRYGTEYGNIDEVTMWVYDQLQLFCNHGDLIKFRVSGWINKTVVDPRLMIIVRDKSGYNLFSYDNLYAGKALLTDPDGYFNAEIGFECQLQEGEYFITMRLDEHHGVRQFSLLDKQVNVISFKVIQTKRTFDAVVNLHGNFSLLTS